MTAVAVDDYRLPLYVPTGVIIQRDAFIRLENTSSRSHVMAKWALGCSRRYNRSVDLN